MGEGEDVVVSRLVRAGNREWEGEKAKKSVERREKIGRSVNTRS